MKVEYRAGTKEADNIACILWLVPRRSHAKNGLGTRLHFRVLAECNFRFKTSDYHMIKQANIMARSPFCTVSLHVEHRNP